MDEYLIFAVLSWGLLIVATATVFISTRRFLKGDLKDVLKWLLVGLWLLAIGYTLFMLQGLVEARNYWEPYLAMFLIMVMAALYLFKASVLLLRFSDDYGFAQVKKARDKRPNGKAIKSKK